MQNNSLQLEDWWPERFLEDILEKYGDSVEAVLLYGSWLRGERDTLPDFYVILKDYRQLPTLWQRTANKILEPNVYQLILVESDSKCSAKYATVSMRSLEEKITNGFHPYLWARFSQPSKILYTKSKVVLDTLNALMHHSAIRMMEEVLGMLPPAFTSRCMWKTALTLTYASELRAENPSKINSLIDHYESYFESRVLENSNALGLIEVTKHEWTFHCSNQFRFKSRLRWKVRKTLGVLLSVARLLKATSTFNQPLQYLLWKIERHTGIKENATELQLKHPLIFSWPLLWKLYRKGGFK